MPSPTRSILVIIATLAAALVLLITPLPEWAEAYRPQWPLMVLTYWVMAVPHRIGVIGGWTTGLLVDTVTGTLLGQHALTHAVGSYLVLTQHRRLRLFPWWQQTATMSGIFLFDRAIAFLVAGATSETALPWSFWIAPMSSIALWPLVLLLLQALRQRLRIR